MKKRKTLSLVLALVMALGLSVPAMADGEVNLPVGSVADFYSSKASTGTRLEYGQAYLVYPQDTTFQYTGSKAAEIRCDATAKQGYIRSIPRMTVKAGDTFQLQDPANAVKYDLTFVTSTGHEAGFSHIILEKADASVSTPVKDATIKVDTFLYASEQVIRTEKNDDGKDVLVLPAGASVKYSDGFGGNVTCFQDEADRSVGTWKDGQSFTLPETGVVYRLTVKHALMGPSNKYVMYEAASDTVTDPAGQALAQPSTQAVNVDGRSVEFAMYALNGGSVNYIRVRDLAALLNGTAAQFEVGWDGHVSLTAKTPYTGSADQAPFRAEMPYTVYTEPTYVNGAPVPLDAIQIQYNGGGFTYYKLRDLAQALGFNVGWDQQRGVYVETGKPYDPAN